jgi:FKBP-type peptidyl-prolyl cis-trans isomerase FklB
MKYCLACVFFLAIATLSYAQKPPVKKPVVQKPASADLPKNENDSLSYAVGLSVVNFYRQQGIQLNTAMVTKALNDKTPLLTEDQANLLFMCHSNPQLCAYVKTGEAFLAENKKNKNVKTTASGLQYEVIAQGTGIKPGPADTIVINYRGTLPNGSEFDNSYKRGAPLTIGMNQVVRGWTEGISLMPAGSKFKLYIPYQLGYGLNDNGAIPAGSVLIFDLELLDVRKLKN